MQSESPDPCADSCCRHQTALQLSCLTTPHSACYNYVVRALGGTADVQSSQYTCVHTAAQAQGSEQLTICHTVHHGGEVQLRGGHSPCHHACHKQSRGGPCRPHPLQAHRHLQLRAVSGKDALCSHRTRSAQVLQISKAPGEAAQGPAEGQVLHTRYQLLQPSSRLGPRGRTMQKWEPCALLPSMTGKVHSATLEWRRCAGQQLPPGAWPDSLGGGHDAAAAADPAHTAPADGRRDGPLQGGTQPVALLLYSCCTRCFWQDTISHRRRHCRPQQTCRGPNRRGPRDALALLCHSRCWCGAPTSGTVPQTALCSAC